MPARQKPAVLIVDDDTTVRFALSEMVTDFGYHVLEASRAADALSLLRGNPAIGLLITDVNMPGTDGLQLAAKVWKMRPDLPIIFASGRPRPKGLRLFLAKPFREIELRSLMNEALGA